MTDFTQTATVKTAVRELAAPIDSMAAFTLIIDDILTNNPWGCTSYELAGVTLPGVSKASESYTGRVIYENNVAKTVGTISIKAPTPSAFNTDVSTIIATTALNTAMGGTPSHDHPQGFFSCTLKCHHSNGELYSVRFARDSVTLSSYEADAIRTGLEILKLTRSLHSHNQTQYSLFPIPRYGNDLDLRNSRSDLPLYRMTVLSGYYDQSVHQL